MILELVVEVKFTVKRTAIGTDIRTQVSKKKKREKGGEGENRNHEGRQSLKSIHHR